MRKYICLFVICFLILSLVVCNSKKADDSMIKDIVDENIVLTKENFEDYFLISWHWENPTYKEPGYLDFGYGTLKAEFHVDISPKSKSNVENVIVEFQISIDNEYWGKHSKSETLTLRYDGEGSFWVPISRSHYTDYTSYLPDKDDVIIEVVNVSGKIID